MPAHDSQLRALVAVTMPDEGEWVERRLTQVARDFGCEEPPSRVDRSRVFVLGVGLEAAESALRMARRIYELAMGEGALRLTVVVHVSSTSIAVDADAHMRATLRVAPEGYVTVTESAARWLVPEARRGLTPYRTHDHLVILIEPDPGQREIGHGLRRSGVWWPPVGRYVAPAAPPRRPEIPWYALNEDWLREGLLVRERVRQLREIDALAFSSGLHHVIGPSWVGKSYVAEVLAQRWRQSTNKFVSLILLGNPSAFTREPTWWAEWRRSDQRALWILDGADEGHWRGVSVNNVLEPWSKLESTERDRLAVLVFQRDDTSLSEARHSEPLAEAPLFLLLPADEEQAELALCRGEQRAHGRKQLAHARAQLERIGKPELAGNLRVVRAAAALDADASLGDVWGKVLESLFEPTRSAVSHDPGPQRLRDLAGRLAAVMLLSGHEHVALPSGDSECPLQWSHVFGTDLFEHSRLLERSSVLADTALGLRFREVHTQELLAAWALRDLDALPLRELLTDEDGCVVPALGEVASHVAVLASERAKTEAVERWQAARPLPWSAAEAEELLAILMSEAQGFIRFDTRRTALRRLARAETFAVARLSDPQEPEAARRVLLEIALANRWSSAIEPAIQMALDPALPSLRTLSVWLACELGNDEQVDRLRPLLERRDGTTETSQAQAALLEQLLKREPLLWVLERAPSPEPHFADSRSILVHQIGERLGAQDARVVLGRLYGVAPALVSAVASTVLEELEEPALDRLINDWDPDDADDVSLVAAALERHDHPGRVDQSRLLDEQFRHDQRRRRALYVAVPRSKQPWSLWRHLQPAEDLDWLFELAEASSSPSKGLLADLWRLAHPDRSGTLAGRVLDWLAQKHPAFVRAQDEAAIEYARANEEHRALDEELHRHHEERAAAKRTLASVLSEVLDGQHDERDQLDRLGAMATGSERHDLEGVDGRFDELTVDLRARAVQRLRRLLERVEPTETPRETSYPGRIFYEAQAFATVVLWDDATWLDGALIRRWLLAVLFWSSGEKTGVVRRCLHIDSAATLDAVIAELRRDALRKSFTTLLGLPEELWQEKPLRDAVAALVRDGGLAARQRASLLRLLAWRSPESVGVRRQLGALAGELVRAAESELSHAAIETLLWVDPAHGTAEATARVRDIASAAQALRGFYETSGARHVTWPEWDDEPLFTLGALLCRLPLSWDEPRAGFGWSGPEDHLGELRDAVLRKLAERPGVDVAALVRLAPARRQGLERIRSSVRVRDLLRRLEPPAREPPKPGKVVSALDRSPILALRSVTDLFEAVPALLAGDHARFRDLVLPIAGDPSTDHDEEGTRHEPALQAYVELCLNEGVRRVAPTRATVLSREPRETYGVRPDFLMVTLDGIKLPIEIKWAHNPECVRRLRTQLAEDYLLGSGLKHGIYVVGFRPITTQDCEARLTKLEQERDAVQDEHAVRISIVPLRFGELRPTSQPGGARASSLAPDAEDPRGATKGSAVRQRPVRARRVARARVRYCSR